MWAGAASEQPICLGLIMARSSPMPRPDAGSGANARQGLSQPPRGWLSAVKAAAQQISGRPGVGSVRAMTAGSARHFGPPAFDQPPGDGVNAGDDRRARSPRPWPNHDARRCAASCESGTQGRGMVLRGGPARLAVLPVEGQNAVGIIGYVRAIAPPHDENRVIIAGSACRAVHNPARRPAEPCHASSGR